MKNNIITIVLIAVLGLVAFSYLKGSNNSDSALVSDTRTADSTDARYIYNMLQQMAQVKLDNTIFTSTVFQNLKDNTVSFSPQAAGRPNPFAPRGTESPVAGQSTVGTTPAPSSSVR